MVPYLLDIVYLLLLVAASPWLVYRSIATGRYREGFAEKLLGSVPRSELDGRYCVWFHAVSVGEVSSLGPLLSEIARGHPDWHLVLSTTTATGHALAQRKYPELSVFYCPLDFSWATRRAANRIRPNLLVLTELELWPNLIRAASRAGARVAVINGRLSQRSHQGYRRLGPAVRWMLRQIDLLVVQSETYRQRFVDLGAPPDRVHVTGSMKFDGAETDRNNPRTQALRGLAGFEEGDVVFIAGSTQDAEESMALATYEELSLAHPKLRLVVVPRHPERFDAVARMLSNAGADFTRRSSLDDTVTNREARVLLVDTLGELSAWWGTASIALVGGSFGRRGGQNMIEPAAYGAAVCFGPNTQNFRDVVEAMRLDGAAAVVRDGDELTSFVRRCLEEPTFADRMGQAAKSLVARQLGASRRTADLLFALADKKRRPIAGDAHSGARAA